MFLYNHIDRLYGSRDCSTNRIENEKSEIYFLLNKLMNLLDL